MSEQSWMNNIAYGNPLDSYLPYLKKGNYDSLFPELSKLPFPPNDSEATKDEIRELIQYQDSAEQKDEKLMSRWMYYDKNLIETFKTIARKKISPIEREDENIDKLIDDCINDCKPILMKLKYHYQRPRPFQLACAYKARLFPFGSGSAQTPSYPSGHVFMAAMITELLGRKFPEHYDYLNELTNDIASSRLFLGLHYPTDNDFSKKCAKIISESKEFTEKYKI